MSDGIRKVAGKIITRPMGEYNPDATYDILDFVTIGNKLYISKKPGLVGVDPSTDDGTNWQMLIDGSADLEEFEATVDEKIATVNADMYDIVERLTADESSIDAAQSRANEAYSLADSVGAALTEHEADMNQKFNTVQPQRYHTANGIEATDGYVGIAKLTVTGRNVDTAILFGLFNRQKVPSNAIISFANDSTSVDPGLSYAKADGEINLWVYKSDVSTWILIAQKAEAYDYLYVNEYVNNMPGKISVEWINTFYETLPTENITPFTTLAGKLTKQYIDDIKTRANEAYSLADSVGAALTENFANMNGQLTNFESRIATLETKINNLTFNINTDTGNLEWGME